MTKSEYDRLTNSAISLLQASNDPSFSDEWQSFFWRVAIDDVWNNKRYVDNFHLSDSAQFPSPTPIENHLQAS